MLETPDEVEYFDYPDDVRSLSSKAAEREELRRLMDDWIAEHGEPITQGATETVPFKPVWGQEHNQRLKARKNERKAASENDGSGGTA
jgi:hypothetical protein